MPPSLPRRHPHGFGPLSLTVLCALLCGGCGAFQSAKPLTRAQQVERLDRAQIWEVKGKFSSSSLKIEKGKRFKGSINLKIVPKGFRMIVAGPLGVGRQRIIGLWSQQEVHLTTTAGYQALDLELGGLPHPSALRRWLLGLPATRGLITSQDALGRNLYFSENGWEVTYLEYVEYKGISLPMRIRFTSKESNALIAISRWKLRK